MRIHLAKWLSLGALQHVTLARDAPFDEPSPDSRSRDLASLKGLKLYCHMLSLSNTDCETKFTGITVNVDGGPSVDPLTNSVVSRKAADTCLKRSNLQTSAMAKMFGVPLNDMSHYAQGGSGRSTGGSASASSGRFSDAVREQARQDRQEQLRKERAELRKLQVDPSWMPKGHDSESAANALGELLYDELSSYFRSKDAYDHPEKYGPYAPTIEPEAPQRDVTPTPPTLDNNDNGPTSDDDDGGEFKPTTDSDMTPEPKDTGPSNTDRHDDTAPILLTDSEIDIDEDIATPVYDDLNTKTALQKCQEEEEKKLITQIGISHTDENAEWTREARVNRAARMLSMGICDTAYYGKDKCQEHANKQWSVPLPPDQEAGLKQWHEDHPVCPQNLVRQAECQRAKQEVLKRYAVTSGGGVALNVLFSKGRAISSPIPVAPRLWSDEIPGKPQDIAGNKPGKDGKTGIPSRDLFPKDGGKERPGGARPPAFEPVKILPKLPMEIPEGPFGIPERPGRIPKPVGLPKPADPLHKPPFRPPRPPTLPSIDITGIERGTESLLGSIAHEEL